jgi:YidC/Oxa1 family membrane protein insertase
MDRRVILAIGLMLIVAVLPSILFPPKPSPTRGAAVEAGDTVTRVPDTTTRAPSEAIADLPDAVRDSAPRILPDSESSSAVTVESPLYRYTFSGRGARLVGATLKDYRSFAATDSGLAQLIPADPQFLASRLVVGNDTISLADWAFQPSQQTIQVRDSGTTLSWVATRGGASVRLTYRFRPDRYLFDVSGDFSDIATRGLVLVGLGPRIALVEADSVEDFRVYAVVTKATKTESLKFGSLDAATVVLDPEGNPVTVPGERRELSGPFEWVAVKSKYFAVAVMALEGDRPQFGGAVATAGLPSGKHNVRTDVLVSLPAPGGVFTYSVYAGPQEFGRLARVGHDFEDISALWYRCSHRLVAPEPEGNALERGDAGRATRAKSAAGAVQERFAEVAAGNDEVIPRARSQSAGGMSSDAHSHARALCLVLCIS